MTISTISPQGEAMIVAEEGEVLKAYRCPAGVLTIGVGITSAAGVGKVTSGMTITREQSRKLLRQALTRNYIPRVKRMGLDKKQNVFDASVSFDFNTGRIHNASWVGRFLAGSYATAEKSFKSWNKGGGRVLAGLVRRRNHEWDVLRHNKYPGGKKGAAPASVSTSDADVKFYQESLAKLGYYAGAIDGVDGPKTKAAVLRFQKDHKLTADGIVGPATRATLKRALEAKAQTKGVGTGGAAGGAGGVATTPVDGPDAVGDVLVSALGWSAAAAGIILAGFLIWRYRGPLFAWLPEPVKDAFENRGVTIGRRVAT